MMSKLEEYIAQLSEEAKTHPPIAKILAQIRALEERRAAEPPEPLPRQPGAITTGFRYGTSNPKQGG